MRRPAPPRRAALLGLLPALLALAAGCGASFSSVRQTAELGQGAQALSAVLRSGPRLCELLLHAPARDAAAAPCAAAGAEETAATMAQGAGLLGRYARGLSALAQEGQLSASSLLDLVGNSRATAAGEAGGSLSVSSAGQKLSALMALASTRWRRKELGRLIAAAEPHVAAVGAGLRQHLRLQLELVHSLRGDGAGERGLLKGLRRELQDLNDHLRCGDKDLTCRSLLRYGPLLAMELAALGSWADEHEGALRAYDAALHGFLAAHSILARHAASPEGLGPDEAIRQELLAAMQKLAPAAPGGTHAGPR